MNILAWFNPTRWLILAAVLAILLAGVFGYGEWRAHEATAAESQRWQLAVDRQKVDAATMLAAQTSKVLALERALSDVTAKLEGSYESRRTESKAAQQSVADALVRGAGRLRDPNARCGGGGGGAKTQVAANPASGAEPAGETGGVFSEPASRLLQRITGESQEVNDAYALCRGWIVEVRDLMNR